MRRVREWIRQHWETDIIVALALAGAVVGVCTWAMVSGGISCPPGQHLTTTGYIIVGKVIVPLSACKA